MKIWEVTKDIDVLKSTLREGNYNSYRIADVVYLLLTDPDLFELPKARQWLVNFHALNWAIPIGALTSYLLFLVICPRVLKKGLPLKSAFCLWNTVLAIFSTFGVINILPNLYHSVTAHGLKSTVCNNVLHTRFSDATVGKNTVPWLLYFCFSKIPELFDTVFLIFLNPQRPVQFLQWYHHSTVLIFSWAVAVHGYGPGIWFCAMNFIVHSIMYSYFALTTFISPKKMWIFANIVTTAQLSQMLAGIYINGMMIYYQISGQHIMQKIYSDDLSSSALEKVTCKASNSILTMAVIIYGSYFYLFLQIFVSKIIKPRLVRKLE